MARHFRQVVLWPVQLMPLKPGVQVQRHWEALEKLESAATALARGRGRILQQPGRIQGTPLQGIRDVPALRAAFPVRLEPSARKSGSATAKPSMRVFRRTDVAQRARDLTRTTRRSRSKWRTSTCTSFSTPTSRSWPSRCMPTTCLWIACRTRCSASAAPTRPSGTLTARGGNCPRKRRMAGCGRRRCWRPRTTRTRPKYLVHVARNRAPAIAGALGISCSGPWCSSMPARSARCATGSSSTTACRSWHTSPFDDPTELSRADFVRLGLVTRPG